MITIIPTSYAGFEWVPPSESPKQMGTDKFNFDIAPPQVKEKMIAPLYNTRVQNSVRPQAPGLSGRSITGNHAVTKSSTDMRPNLHSARNQPVSLYINPYPLERRNNTPASLPLTQRSIEQAMIEQAGRVTPMNLGQDMYTGAQTSYDRVAIAHTAPRKATMIDPVQRPVAPKPIMQAQQRFENAEGFGSALPLALALSQVIPSEFTHNFATGVDPGTTVSWQGGKPWNQVLDDMLRPSGLTAVINGKAVSIAPL